MTEPVEHYVNAAVTAAHLGTTAATVRAWAKDGTIPGVKPKGRWMFRLSEVDEDLSPAR